MKKNNSNRKFKDNVFQLLFNDKKKLLELFNALEGTNYTDPEQVTIETLSAALYNTMINDLAFSIADCYIILTEHQSTPNDNMPIRMMLYAAREYEKILRLDELLKEKRCRIPTPHFYVLYNGTKEQPPVREMRLSDSFCVKEDEPGLELVVKMININESIDHPILSKCPTLRGYSRLVALVRNNLSQKMERDEAIETAIGQCIREGVLVDFLKRHGTEVANDMFKEYTWEDAMRIRGEEAEEKGLERGMQKGMEKGMQKGMEKGTEEGIRNFISAFREEGFSDEKIQEKLQKKFLLTEEKARAYCERFTD